MPVRIRPMIAADVEPAAAAVLRGDWGDRSSWFRFAVDNPSCDPIVAVDGHEVVGTGVGTRHGSSGWVGTIFVVPARRGEGIGYELSRVVAEGLEGAGCRTLALTATAAGRPVYERLGFVEVDWYVLLEPSGSADRSQALRDADIRPLAAADLAEALALDRAATGEDRSAVLVSMAEVPGGLVLRDADGSLRGFLLRGPWPGGATIAPDPGDALRLSHARVAAAKPGHRVLAGLLASNTVGLELFVAHGWAETRRIVRMQRGEPLGWRPDWIWGQLSFALG